jgi:hypothetical protein
MPFSRNDMVFKDYSWTVLGDDDPKRTGHPDNVLLNRREGYEVLAFLQRNYPNVPDAQKAERAIRNSVPVTIHSRALIKDWLTRNWLFI